MSQYAQVWSGDSGGGGSTVGVPRVLGPFPILFDDAGLETGVTFYTPTVGDAMLGGIIEIATLWDGTTPRGDIGQFTGGTVGLISATGVTGGGWFMDSSGTSNGGIFFPGAGLGEYGNIFLFKTAAPLKFVVSQNGESGGGDPGSTQGEANVYLVIATPSLT